MVTPALPSCQPLLSTKPPVVFIENEWDMTLGPVYLQLVDLNSLISERHIAIFCK